LSQSRHTCTWYRIAAAVTPPRDAPANRQRIAGNANPLGAGDLVEETVVVGAWTLSIRRPRDSEALLDEHAFEHEEYLPYWAELWPSGVALARRIASRSLGGVHAVELGCGLAVPSIVAALGGARVLATDWAPDALPLIAGNAARNGAVVETMLASWTAPAPLIRRGPFELVLGSDLLYEARNVELLALLLPQLVAQRGEALIADPGRPHAPRFLDAVAASFAVESSRPRGRGRVVVHRLRPRANRGVPETLGGPAVEHAGELV
jgi:predicted nicotinamide N-methyase